MISVFAYSRRGCRTAKAVMEALSGEEIQAFTMEKYLEPGFLPIPKPSSSFYGERFGISDAMIFVGSCGIAVRMIAPFVKDKKQDPAVLVIDELGTFVIPILSGHIGGANALAKRLSAAISAAPVITTATDINGKFSVDAWAAGNGFSISSMPAAKAVSASILEGNVPICSRFPVKTELPAGTVPGEEGPVGILLSYRKERPFGVTLRLTPKVLHLGLGCRRDTPKEAIESLVFEVLQAENIDKSAIKCAASIDLKANEQGLLAFCREQQIPVQFYSARELRAVPGTFTPSKFVAGVTGVDNVCERSAMVGANHLIVKKTARNGVTVALAEEYREVYFG